MAFNGSKPHTDHLYREIRNQQLSDPLLGDVYEALYEAENRLRDGFYEVDAIDMPFPIIRFGALPRNRLAEYIMFDGIFWTVITIDPAKHRTAAGAVEYLAHEMTHMWMDWLGYPMANNYHDKTFHETMASYGISTSGRFGDHRGYIGDVWENWLKNNDDLKLDQFLLSDEPQLKRRLNKWACPVCGFSFQSRRTDVIVRCQHCLEDDELLGKDGARMEMV